MSVECDIVGSREPKYYQTLKKGELKQQWKWLDIMPKFVSIEHTYRMDQETINT